MRVLKSLILVVCLAVSVMAQDTPADNWSQFRGNHSLTGVSQSNVSNSLKQLWTYEAGESIESSAATVEDVIAETMRARISERGGRADDRGSDTSLEDRKRHGYF